MSARRKSIYKMGSRKSSLAANVNSIIKRRAEKKVGLVGAVAAAVVATGVVLPVSTVIAQGDNFDQRTGDKIRFLHHLVKTRFTAVTTSQSCRFILFVDRFNQGTLPGVTEILQNNVFIAAYNQLTVVQQKRFHIIRDWHFDCSITGENIKSLNFNVGDVIGDTFYNGTTAVSASAGKNSVFLLVIGSLATGNYDYSIESSFIDL